MRSYVIPFYILTCFLLPQLAFTQNCGCEDEGNCPFEIASNSNSQVCYTIDAAVNNNLADPAQGVCGVYVNFKHGSIGRLNMSLQAPDGTTVQLVGSDFSCIDFTPIAVWDILFVPCAENCEPVDINNCADECPFDACCGWGNAFYSATYHPYQGCLEDFNTGSVNGQWCLNIDNDPSNNGGDIFDFEVIFCDPTGIDCCEADAGNLLNPDDAICEGDTSLVFDIEPDYGIIIPDTLEYGYTYIISRNDTIVDYQDSVDLTTFPVGIYQICGLSFLLSEEGNIPAANSGWTLTDLDANLQGLTPLFCGDISNNCFVINIAAPPPPVSILDTICVGSCFVLGDTCLADPGMYSMTIESFAGCDSVVNLTLTVLDNDTTSIFETVCFGGNYMIGDSTYTQSGIFPTPFVSANGCDSLVMVNLTVLDSIVTNLVETICIGDTIQVGFSQYFETGNYTDTLLSSNGCDSIVHLDLTVIDLSVFLAIPDTITCTALTVMLDASGSSNEPGITYSWTTTDGNIIGAADGITVEVDTSGWYYFTVTQSGCSETDSVLVHENLDLPQISIAPPDTLNCLNVNVTLDASNSSGGSNLTFFWESQGGFSIDNSNTPTPTVYNPDILKLSLMNEDNSCADSAFVEIIQDIEDPIANAGNDTTLTCIDTCLTLSANASIPFNLLDFEWSGGNIKSGANTPNPLVDLNATYQIIVTNTQNFCKDTALINVGIDTILPSPIITLPDGNMLTCLDPEVTLNGSNSLGQNLVYQWIGNVQPQNNLPIVFANQPGEYTLIIQNGTNGCLDSTAVLIEQDSLQPVANAGPPAELDCGQPTYVLGGTGVELPDQTYVWTTLDGHFVDDPMQLHPTVDSAGTYVLTVTNMLNGCFTQDSVSILEDFAQPVADAGPYGVIDCIDTEYILDASNTFLLNSQFSDTILFTFEWEAIFNPDFHPEYAIVSANFPDTFIVHVTHFTSQCTDTDTVVITQDIFPPQIDAGSDVFLDCNTGEATLSGIITNQNANHNFIWSTPNGNIVNGSNTLNPVVDSVGMYILEVTDQISNCTSHDTTFAIIDSLLCMPFAFAGEDSLINCYTNDNSLVIAANGPVGSAFCYEWTAIDGVIESQDDPFFPNLQNGTFVFTVTNKELQLSASDTITIDLDTEAPIVVLDTLMELNCFQIGACVPINVLDVPFGPDLCYNWETFGGEICTDPTERPAEIRGEGIYLLTVTNKANGCSGTAAINVEIGGIIPESDAGINQELECGDSTAMLDCSNSIFTGNDVLQWFSNTGNFESATNICSPTISINNPQDTFYLVITNPENFCSDTSATVVFAAPNCFPECDAGSDMSLTCDIGTVELEGSAMPMGPNICIEWVALTGNIAAGSETLNPTVDQPGFYQIRVTRKENGSEFTCTDEVQVTADTLPPDILIDDPLPLTCEDTCVTLKANTIGTDFLYFWETVDGNIKNGGDTPNPEVNQTGTYSLTITNTQNGCANSTSVVVSENLATPTANISPTMLPVIDCSGSAITLTSSGSSPGTLLWTTQGGNILTDPPTSSVVQLNAAGKYCLEVKELSSGCVDSVCVMINSDMNVPTCNAGAAPSITCTISTIQLQGSADGGAVLEYEWTGPGNILNPNTLSPTIDAPGTYTLTVNDVTNECLCTSTITIEDDRTPPTAFIEPPQEIDCQNLEILLDASGSQPAADLEFEWYLNNSLVNQSNNFLTDEEGDYTLIITDISNDCRDTTMVTVTRDDQIPEAEAGADTTLTCVRTELYLSSTGSTTAAEIVHVWQTSDGNIVGTDTTDAPLIDAPGLYYLLVQNINNDCEIIDSVIVNLDTLAPNAQIDKSITPTLTCDSVAVSLDASLSGSTDSLIFKWQGGQSTPEINVSQPGNYSVTICHERTGCTDSDAIEVQIDTLPPIVNTLEPEQLTCDILSVQLSAVPNNPNYEYEWSGGDCDSLCQTASPWVSEATLYNVTVTDINNGCTETNFVFVEENRIPPDAVASVDGSIDCMQNQVNLSGFGSTQGNVSYLWTTTSGGVIQNPTSLNTSTNIPGWYYLAVINELNGCQAIDSVEVIASSIAIDSALIVLDHPDCRDPDGYIFIDTVYGGTPDFLYFLNDDFMTTYPQFSFLDPDAYQIEIEDGNGCRWDTLVVLEMPGGIVVDLGTDIELSLGDSMILKAQVNLLPEEIDTVLWNPLPNPNCPGCLEQMVSPDETTTYQVTVVDTNFCQASSSITVLVNEEIPLYIPNAFSPDGNGENDHFIVYGSPSIENIPLFQIFDRWGNLVHEAKDFRPNDPDFGWDGKFGGKMMNAQVLVWKVTVQFPDGRMETIWGDLTLVR